MPSNAQAGGDTKAQEAETRTQGGWLMACRALASMKRAAETICEITGEGDDRCVDARRRVEENTKNNALRVPVGIATRVFGRRRRPA